MYPVEEYPEGVIDDTEAVTFEKWFEEKAVCIVNGAAGIYVPQEFAEGRTMDEWHVDPEDATILLEGQEHKYYWDVWDTVLSNAYCVNPKDGKTHRLHQDDDLFAVPDMPQ